MTLTWHTAALLLALLCFFVAAVGLPTGRISVVALGLLFVTLAMLLP